MVISIGLHQKQKTKITKLYSDPTYSFNRFYRILCSSQLSKNVTFFILAIIPLCLERIWIIFGRNTAGGIYSLLLCAFTYYVIVQLGLLSVAIETELKSTAPGTHHTRLIRAKSGCISSHRWLWTSFYSHMKKTFRKLIMASVAVSKLGCLDLVFLDPSAKIKAATVVETTAASDQ